MKRLLTWLNRKLQRQQIMRRRTGAVTRRESDEWGHRNVAAS